MVSHLPLTDSGSYLSGGSAEQDDAAFKGHFLVLPPFPRFYYPHTLPRTPRSPLSPRTLGFIPKSHSRSLRVNQALGKLVSYHWVLKCTLRNSRGFSDGEP